MSKNAKRKQKIIVILGTTASGKTSLGVKLAYKFNGEIISADSRQVYRGMDVGTGKDLKDYCLKFPISNPPAGRAGFQFPNKFQISNSKIKKFKIVKIPYHLIDVVNPKTRFSLAKYQELAYKAIDDILARGKLPIIVGGTGLYLQAVVDGYKLSKAKPDRKSREELEKLDANKLFKELQKLNPAFADKLHKSDRKNKRRLIRYIEITKEAKLPIGSLASKTKYDFLLIGLTWPRQILQERIYKRLIERLEKENMVGEVKRLHQQGVSWKRLESFGLEYKYVSLYLRKKLTYEEMVEKLNIAIRQFAKKQMTWFRRWERQGAKIHWLHYFVKSDKISAKQLNRAKDRREAERLVKGFLK